MGIAKTTLLRYQNTLIKFGLIKNVTRCKSTIGHYRNNIYKVTPIEGGANIELRQVQILGGGSANFAPGVVQNLHPNNTNLNITNITTTTTKREKDAVAVVNFKKLKEKGEGKIDFAFFSLDRFPLSVNLTFVKLFMI